MSTKPEITKENQKLIPRLIKIIYQQRYQTVYSYQKLSIKFFLKKLPK